MSGGGGSTNTIQSATPWGGVQPYLTNLYSSANTAFNSGGPQVYSGTEVSPINSQQDQALQAIISQGMGGAQTNLNSQQQTAAGIGTGGANGVLAGELLDQNMMNGNSIAQQGLLNMGSGNSSVDQALQQQMLGKTNAEQQLTSMLGSDYLNVNNNPALQQAMNAANYNTTLNYNNAVMPALNSQYAAAGRFGSGAMGNATNMANNTLATQIANTNAGMSLQELEQLQNNQLSAANSLGTMQYQAGNSLGQLQNAANQYEGNLQLGAAGNYNATQGAYSQLLPSLGQMGMSNASNALQAGNQYQTQAQNLLNSQIAQYNARQQQPYSNINWLGQILAGANAFGTTSTSGQQTNLANPYSTALGAGMLGMNAYNAGLLGGGAAATGLGSGALFSSTAGLSGAALDAALAGSATSGVLASGAGGSALMGLAMM